MGKERVKVLSIAGFDPSGGAGVIADCKTFEQIKVQGMAVVTANTIQSEDQFFAVNWVEQNVLLAQLRFLLERYSFEWVKIGLIENVAVFEKVLDLLLVYQPRIKIVWDPILRASSGGSWNENRFASIEKCLDRIFAITPNLPEFEHLFGNTSVQSICINHKIWVLIKGGHSIDKGKDQLITPEGKRFVINPKIIGNDEKHGTGCILSSAWLAYMARKYPTLKAFQRAKFYLEKRLISNPSKLAYHK
jgi:hydroxymethylpyrimidine/phosphomethylpyrimidine kinase